MSSFVREQSFMFCSIGSCQACFRVALDAYMDGLRHPSKAALDHNARFRVKHVSTKHEYYM